MKKPLLCIAVVLSALVVVLTGSWWVWQTWYSAKQFREAVQEGIETGGFSRAEWLKGWGAGAGDFPESEI